MSENNTWRDAWRPIIAGILAQCEGLSLQEKRKKLRESCPLGIRKYHPYKIWLDECRRQLKLKPPLGQKSFEPAEGQKSLFD